MQEPSSSDVGEYRYNVPGEGHHHAYILPFIESVLDDIDPSDKRLFDLGCGNGSVAAHFAARGFKAAGVDPSATGIEVGRKAYPDVDLHEGSAYDDLSSKYGTFPIVVSLEVVEHLYSPKIYAKTLYELTEPGGTAIVSTPYHGYLKNLALAVTGKWDAHHDPMWDHGHIKFWSIPTLGKLLSGAGFEDISYERVGRIPPLAKSLIAVAKRPG